MSNSAPSITAAFCDECRVPQPDGFGLGPEHQTSCSLHDTEYQVGARVAAAGDESVIGTVIECGLGGPVVRWAGDTRPAAELPQEALADIRPYLGS